MSFLWECDDYWPVGVYLQIKQRQPVSTHTHTHTHPPHPDPGRLSHPWGPQTQTGWGDKGPSGGHTNTTTWMTSHTHTHTQTQMSQKEDKSQTESKKKKKKKEHLLGQNNDSILHLCWETPAWLITTRLLGHVLVAHQNRPVRSRRCAAPGPVLCHVYKNTNTGWRRGEEDTPTHPLFTVARPKLDAAARSGIACTHTHTHTHTHAQRWIYLSLSLSLSLTHTHRTLGILADRCHRTDVHR